MTQIKSGYDAVIDTLNEMVLCFGFAPISSFVLTTSPRRLPLSDWRPSSLPGMPSLLAVNNCRSSCSQVLSAFFFSCWDRAVSWTISLRLIELSFRIFNLVLRFHAIRHWMPPLICMGTKTQTVWRGLKFLSNDAPVPIDRRSTEPRSITRAAFGHFLEG